MQEQRKSLVMISRTIRTIPLLICITVFCSSMTPLKKGGKNNIFISNYENVLGTSFELKVKAINSKQADLAEKAALQEITRLSEILSGYDKNSEFEHWMSTHHQPVTISKELMEVLSACETWSMKTNGALNPSAETINMLWKKAEARQELPTAKEINNAVALATQQHWQLDLINGTAIHTSGAALKLNSFVKSYIIEKATKAALSIKDVSGIVMNIGGDIVVKGDMNELIKIANPISNAINDPALTSVSLQNKAIATSGNYRRGNRINGKWYSHIVDPRTGIPTEGIISATVIADDGVEAGALATAFNVLSVNESVKLASQFEHTDYLIITNKGEHIQSKGWSAFETASSPKSIVPTTQDKDWNTDYQVAVNVALAQQPGFAKRPFLAIWVADAENKPIRTVTVWFNKQKWLRDLRSWFNAYNGNFTPESLDLGSVASATRMPGMYTINWDGKDDKGNYVKQGNYTINIEVAREHGTYQLMQQEVKCVKKAQSYTLQGNVEVTSATIDYKKK